MTGVDVRVTGSDVRVTGSGVDDGSSDKQVGLFDVLVTDLFCPGVGFLMFGSMCFNIRVMWLWSHTYLNLQCM